MAVTNYCNLSCATNSTTDNVVSNTITGMMQARPLTFTSTLHVQNHGQYHEETLHKPLIDFLTFVATSYFSLDFSRNYFTPNWGVQRVKVRHGRPPARQVLP